MINENVIYWVIVAVVTCFAMYITERGWPFLILMFIYLLILNDNGEKEKNSGNNDNSTTTTSGT